MLKNRANLVAGFLEECGLDAFIFLHLPSIRHLCGFSGTDGALVVWAGGSAFLTDSRYTTQAENEVSAEELRQYRVKKDGILTLVAERRWKRIGFEGEQVPYATVEDLRGGLPHDAELVSVTAAVKSLRGVKDADEIGLMEEAARLNAEAFSEILPQIRPGVREKDLALSLEFALRRRGGEEKAFDFIVASGPRGALPHGVASEKEIRAGELVTIDFGTRIGGYHSDETVTVAVGEVEPRLRQIFDTVLQAHDLALAAVRPGVELKQLDAIARDHIAAAGFGDFFGHGLGHGVGLEIHEFPTLSPRSADVAREGMVFTIEPGIYLPEVGGVRIEDTVEVTGEGFRSLTRIPKQWRTLPA